LLIADRHHGLYFHELEVTMSESMAKKWIPLVAALLCAGGAVLGAEKRDEAVFKEKTLLDREKAEEEARDRRLAARRGTEYKAADRKGPRALTMDFSGLERPKGPEEFKGIWHCPPKRQWWTGCCWAFSGTSFLESEIRRIRGKEVKLSEMFAVYWEYVEKVREFLRTKGESLVDEGSQHEAVLLRWKGYGIVRESDYTGLAAGEEVFNHGVLLEEIRAYLDFLRKGGYWDEAAGIAGVRAILDRHMGRPPEKITVEGRSMTPLEFLRDELKLDLDAYVLLVSFLHVPYWTRTEYPVPDNWWHGKNYLNVPLDDWYGALRGAVEAGYSAGIAGDVTEPGHDGLEDVGIVPTFDIPGPFIDASAREFRFSNHTTGDDHGLHVVGYMRKGEHDWFLIKDSSRGGQRGVPGYLHYRDDYVKLKMLALVMHRDAAKGILEKMSVAAARAIDRIEGK
jgi:bleomycin hydrolase